MNIVYTFDDGYVEITAVSILSLLKSNESVDEINIIIVDCGISDENKEHLKKLVADFKRKIVFVDGKGMESKIPIKLDLLYWSFVCYVRLFFSELLPNYDRVLHVDCDTIVEGNLENIYNLQLDDGKLSAAAYDCLPTSKYAAGMEADEEYYSSGIILFDLKSMRKDNTQQKFVDYIVEKEGKLPHLDQDVFNVVLKGKIQTLPPQYNLMTQNLLFGKNSCKFFSKGEPYYSVEEMTLALKEPVLYHLVGYKYVSKPWAQPCYHPMNKLWLKYFSCLKFESNKDIISYKLKKYGLFREVVCYLWNVCYKIPAFRTVEFLVEKNNVRRRCAQLAKD